LTFVADLPGLKLENYVSESLNSSVEVLKGRINLEIEFTQEVTINEETGSRKKKELKKKNYTLEVGDKMEVSGFFKVKILIVA